jgi:hypothetical protein
MRTEIYQLTDGIGLFNLKGEGENILYYDQRPLAIEWFDNQGSIGKYLVRAGQRQLLDTQLKDLRYFAENGIPDYVALSQAAYPLLQLLANGAYELIYPFNSQSFGLDLIEYGQTSVTHFYPTELTLISLQKKSSLDISRIRYFEEQIQAGHRPILFALGSTLGGDKYLLDGHHKAEAYGRLLQPPDVFFIRQCTVPGEGALSREALAAGLDYLDFRLEP